MDIALWGVLPYLMIVIIVAGTIWRYRYDKFGWTTRSSQLYESRLLRIGSPMFHIGLLFVVLGHVVGLLIPASWTAAVGITEQLYHINALVVGGIAGFCTLAGIVILIYRRRTIGPVFMATTRNDKLMYVVLTGTILLGLWTTVLSIFSHDPATIYRDTVSPWFRSLWIMQPDVASMAQASLSFKVHTLVGMALFMLWPFTRLVHAMTAPVHYLFRPYIVYRSRDKRGFRPSPTRADWTPEASRDVTSRGSRRR